MESCFMFQWGRFVFQMGASFISRGGEGGCPRGGIGFGGGGGGGVRKKS